MPGDNRRKFVMLRPLDPGSGYSGYFRQEQTGGRVQTTVSVQGFGGGQDVYALLLGGENSAVLGKLNLDARGGGGLHSEVPASNIAGAPIGSYGVLAIAKDVGGSLKTAMVGTVGRGAWVDYGLAEKRAYEALHPISKTLDDGEAVATFAPLREGAAAATQKAPAQAQAGAAQGAVQNPKAPSTGSVAQNPKAPSTGSVAQNPKAPSTGSVAQSPKAPGLNLEGLLELAESIDFGEEAQPAPSAPKAPVQVQPVPSAPKAPVQVQPVPLPIEITPIPPTPPNIEIQIEEKAPARTRESVLSQIERLAREAAGCEVQFELPLQLQSAFWPQSLWPINDLFTRFPIECALQRQDALFLRIPMEGGDLDHLLVGVRLDGNWITGAAFGVPGLRGEMPAGFEQAEFVGESSGNGYYILWEDTK
ncbi:MAG: hypothetical protein LBD02_07355 [Christensenellaceae bacterium]|nr:hypothetical protein [Christensenellaceae bacterium]